MADGERGVIVSDGSIGGTGAGQLISVSLAFQRLCNEIIDHWDCSARASIGGAGDVPSPVLTDTLPAFLDNIAEALTPEHLREDATSDNTPALAHGGGARPNDYSLRGISSQEVFRTKQYSWAKFPERP
jgi:hypothetical protein